MTEEELGFDPRILEPSLNLLSHIMEKSMDRIDALAGSGFARGHSDLLGLFMTSVLADFCCTLALEELKDMGRSLDRLVEVTRGKI